MAQCAWRVQADVRVVQIVVVVLALCACGCEMSTAGSSQEKPGFSSDLGIVAIEGDQQPSLTAEQPFAVETRTIFEDGIANDINRYRMEWYIVSGQAEIEGDETHSPIIVPLSFGQLVLGVSITNLQTNETLFDTITFDVLDVSSQVEIEAELACVSDPECDDGDACTDDYCSDGTCLNLAGNVDDGDPCNGEEMCDSDSGEIVHSGNPCTGDLSHCEPGTGLCVECVIDDHCADDEVCSSGTCIASEFSVGISGLPGSIEASEQVQLSAEVQGGIEPFEFVWRVIGDSAAGIFDDDTSATPQLLAKTPADECVVVSITVTDVRGRVASDESCVFIVEHLPDFFVDIVDSPDIMAIGEQASLQVVVEGAEVEDVLVAWAVYPSRAGIIGSPATLLTDFEALEPASPASVVVQVVNLPTGEWAAASEELFITSDLDCDLEVYAQADRQFFLDTSLFTSGVAIGSCAGDVNGTPWCMGGLYAAANTTRSDVADVNLFWQVLSTPVGASEGDVGLLQPILPNGQVSDYILFPRESDHLAFDVDGDLFTYQSVPAMGRYEFRVTGTDPLGCSDSDTIAHSVYPEFAILNSDNQGPVLNGIAQPHGACYDLFQYTNVDRVEVTFHVLAHYPGSIQFYERPVGSTQPPTPLNRVRVDVGTTPTFMTVQCVMEAPFSVGTFDILAAFDADLGPEGDASYDVTGVQIEYHAWETAGSHCRATR